MKVSKIKEVPKFHAPDQLRRIARILGVEEDVAVGRASYGKGMKSQFHSHKGPEYIHVIGGKGVFRTRGQEVIASPGTTLRLEPGEEHQLENRWSKPLEFVFVYPNSRDIDVLRDKWVKMD